MTFYFELYVIKIHWLELYSILSKWIIIFIIILNKFTLDYFIIFRWNIRLSFLLYHTMLLFVFWGIFKILICRFTFWILNLMMVWMFTFYINIRFIINIEIWYILVYYDILINWTVIVCTIYNHCFIRSKWCNLF